MDAHSATEDEVRSILDDVKREGRIDSVTAWARKAPVPDTAPYDDFARRLAEDRRFLATARAQLAAYEAWPDWCGRCDRDTYRWVQGADGRWQKCPDCNPDATRQPVKAATGYQPFRNPTDPSVWYEDM